MFENIINDAWNNKSQINSKSDRKTFNNINGSPKSVHDIYAYYYWFFPNIMFNYYSWGLSINIVEPITKNKSR